MLSDCSWNIFDQTQEPNILWQELENNIIVSLDKLCPIRKLIVPKNKPEWLSADIVQLMRKRDKVYREARKNKHDPVIWRKAQFLRNRVESLIKQYKRTKIQNELYQNIQNPKKNWENIRSILPNDKGREVLRLVDENTDESHVGENLPTYINSFFANIGSKLANEIMARVTVTEANTFNAPMNNDTDGITNVTITVDEIRDVLKVLDVNKSSAIENLRSMVIIDDCYGVTERFAKLYNGSLTHCVFPDKWKYSTVIPLPKIPNPKTASDMRPVSLLPLPGKILEHIISKRLKRYMEVNGILTNKQHGFRKGKSTISAIIELLDKIYNNINSKLDSYIVYLDLKKAFDTVSHTLLLQKLKSIGLDTNTVYWFNSYLIDRRQQTRLNNFYSDYQPVTYGVPQGSVLGPTLFIIYINELADEIECDLIFYADDTVIFGHDPILLQNELKKVHEWCEVNLLTINCKKSQWMKTKIIERNDDTNVLFKLGEKPLGKVNEYKYLGLTIDTKLNFATHRDNLINRVNLKINFFRKIRKFITIQSASLIYKATILPILEYADFIFDQNIQYINEKLQILQNQALYTVYGQHYLPF